MLTVLRSYTREFRLRVKRLILDRRVHTALWIARCLLMGFCLSAASLMHRPLPLSLALVLSGSGWESALYALGGVAGFRIFWQEAGNQGIAWLAAGLVLALIPGRLRAEPLLLSAGAGVITAVAGLLFRLRLGDTTPVAFYLLRVALAFGVTWLRLRAEQSPGPMKTALNKSIWVLALAQVAPVSWLSMGMIPAAALSLGGYFPAAALSGVALDLAQVTAVPMTGVLCGAFLLAQTPKLPRKCRCLLPPACYLAVMVLSGVWAPEPAAMLLFGGVLSGVLPQVGELPPRRGKPGRHRCGWNWPPGLWPRSSSSFWRFPTTPLTRKP